MAAGIRLTDEEWIEAQRLYEQEGWIGSTISDYFGVALQTVHKRSKHWKKPDLNALAQKRRKTIQDRAVQVVEQQTATAYHQLDRLIGEARNEAIIDANAQEVSRVMLLHRSGATRMRELLARLFSELQLASLREEDLAHLVEVVAKSRSQDAETERERTRIEQRTVEAFQQMLGLDNRADVAKKLVDCMVKVVDLERRVYGIRDEVTEGDVAKALRELADAHD